MLKSSSLNAVYISRAAIVTAALLAWIYLISHISVTLTPSLSHRVFYIDKGFSKAGKGDYVLFDFSSELIEGGRPVKGLKQIGCDEGDYLQEMMGDYFCGMEYLGRAKERSLKGEPLSRFTYRGAVPPGKIFVVGDSVDSFDSRYWGFLDKREIIAKAYPIF